MEYKPRKGDTVKCRGRKWFWLSTRANGKAVLQLLPGEKKICEGMREKDMIQTDPKNLKLIESGRYYSPDDLTS